MMKSSKEETVFNTSHTIQQRAHMCWKAWAWGCSARWRLQHQHRSTSCSSCPQHLSLPLCTVLCHSEREKEKGGGDGGGKTRLCFVQVLRFWPTTFNESSPEKPGGKSHTLCFLFFFCNDMSQASIGFLRKCRTYFVCGTWVQLHLTRFAQYSRLNVDLIVLFSKARYRAICEVIKFHSLFLQNKIL